MKQKVYRVVFLVSLALCIGHSWAWGQDLTLNNQTVTLGGVQNYRNVTLTNNARINVTAYNGTAATTGFLHIRATRIDIDATSGIFADGQGFRGVNNGNGEGPGGGRGGSAYQDSGGGGGYGGAGGAGVRDGVCTLDGPGGVANGSATSNTIEMGSAGGAAGAGDGDGGGQGANGGGAILLEADTIVIHGILSANGANGQLFNNDAAGGGAGGGILIRAKSLTLTGTLRANGGNGADADDKGGGGGGGRIKLFYETSAITGTLQVNGGTGPGCAQEGAAGTTHRQANRPPTVAVNPSLAYTVDEGQPLTFTVTGQDPDGDTLTFLSSTLPTGATFTGTGNTRTLTWTPGFCHAGTHTIDFYAEDNGVPVLSSPRVTVTITVNNVNRDPSITSTAPTSATEDQVYSYQVKGDDPDIACGDDSLTYKLKSGPAGAQIDASTGALTWTPGDADVTAGTRSFEVEVCDKSGKCATQTWTVNIANVNDPPSVTGTPPIEATQGTAYTYGPQVSDPDPGDTHTWKLTKAPTGATIDPQTGQISWTPTQQDVGKNIDFEVEVCDKAGSCAKQSWTVAVKNLNDPPQIVGTPPTTAFVGEAVTYEPKVTDPDPADTHTWSLKKSPPGATIDPNTGKVSWTPQASDSDKEAEFEVEVCDNGTPIACTSQTFKITPRTRCKVDVDCSQDNICVFTQNLGICKPAGCATQTSQCQAAQFCKDGSCISNDCLNKTCQVACRPSDGQCIGSCAGVTCPSGQRCEDGTCKADPCSANPCQQGQICDSSGTTPTCVTDPCQASSCKHGRVCEKGRCIDDPCPSMACPPFPPQRCLSGQCVDRQPCQVDVDCSGAQVCIAKLCYPSGCYQQACQATELCLDAQCKDNACRQGGSANCTQGLFCRPNDGKCVAPCSNVTCTQGQRCVDGACVADPCAGKQCAAGEVCVNGNCEKDACAGSNLCKHGRLCQASTNSCADDPCAGVSCPDAKQVCKAGQCSNPPSCVFDADCPAGSICSQGQCITPTCKDVADCASGQLCIEGSCVPNPCANTQCQNGQFCRNGQCVDSCAGIFCPQDQRCADGKCIADPCAGKQCAAGEVCVNGNCQADPCKADSCRNGRLCSGDKCSTDPCQGIQCPTGQTCQNGQCNGDKPCVFDADCVGDSVCLNKVCRPPNCYKQACSNGQICIDSACKDNPCNGKTCAQGEYCRISDGTCQPICPACPTGQICVDGKCAADSCAGKQCAAGEVCVNGNCEQNACDAPNRCRYQRNCSNQGCSDDACSIVQCPAQHSCRNGVCYAPATPSEPNTEPSPEPGSEVVQEPPSDRASEAVSDASPDTSITDSNAGDGSASDGSSVEKVNSQESTSGQEGNSNGDSTFLASGGCGCSTQTTAGWPVWMILLGLFVGLLGWGRRRNAR